MDRESGKPVAAALHLARTPCGEIVVHAPGLGHALVIPLALAVVVLTVVARSLKRRSIRLERLFVQNLRSRDIEAQVHGRRRPLYEGRLLDHNLHIADYDIPAGSLLAGQTLRELQLPARWGIHVSSILRGHRRINIPGGDMPVFPGDRLQVIGTDEQLREFGNSLRQEVDAGDEHIEQREMKLRSMVIAADSPLAGKTLSQSGIREHYGCMAVGIEMGEGSLAAIAPSRPFSPGDVVGVVGEASARRTRPDRPRGSMRVRVCKYIRYASLMPIGMRQSLALCLWASSAFPVRVPCGQYLRAYHRAR